MAWSLAPSLKVLRDQVNQAYPNRSKKSDGTIDFYAYQAEIDGKSCNNGIYNHLYLSTNMYSQLYMDDFEGSEFFWRSVFFYFLIQLQLLSALGLRKNDFDKCGLFQSFWEFRQQNIGKTTYGRLLFCGLLRTARNQLFSFRQSIANMGRKILCLLFDKTLLLVQANVTCFNDIRLCHQLQIEVG